MIGLLFGWFLFLSKADVREQRHRTCKCLCWQLLNPVTDVGLSTLDWISYKNCMSSCLRGYPPDATCAELEEATCCNSRETCCEVMCETDNWGDPVAWSTCIIRCINEQATYGQQLKTAIARFRSLDPASAVHPCP
eukprot:Gregarina_sp_Pseudo_9__5294@NODE_612_length_2492_cov_14_746025_g578_i0_p3_GENE_NODE_612_length_2492_cov_14_746025_g578_i0NODE_612_length_2492_cov_14_746025_g578_i0_p3_ORF_typecomplete_len136_score11_98_NODE_612_length_2492_cov_14_746025_g578_i09416